MSVLRRHEWKRYYLHGLSVWSLEFDSFFPLSSNEFCQSLGFGPHTYPTRSGVYTGLGIISVPITLVPSSLFALSSPRAMGLFNQSHAMSVHHVVRFCTITFFTRRHSII